MLSQIRVALEIYHCCSPSVEHSTCMNIVSLQNLVACSAKVSLNIFKLTKVLPGSDFVLQYGTRPQTGVCIEMPLCLSSSGTAAS